MCLFSALEYLCTVNATPSLSVLQPILHFTVTFKNELNVPFGGQFMLPSRGMYSVTCLIIRLWGRKIKEIASLGTVITGPIKLGFMLLYKALRLKPLT